MPRQQQDVASKSYATLTAMGWALNPRFSHKEGKTPFLSFLLKTEESGIHEIKVFGEHAAKFKDLNDDEPVSVTAKARRQQVMDGEVPVKNSRGREIWDTQFIVDSDFGAIEDAADLGTPPAKEAKANGGGRPEPAGGRQSARGAQGGRARR